MENKPINAIDVTLTGDIKSSGTAWLDPGEDVVTALNDIAKTKLVVGFQWDGAQKFGVIVQDKS